MSDVNPRGGSKCQFANSKSLDVPYDPSYGERYAICVKDKPLSLRQTSTVELREIAMERATAFAVEQGKTLKVLGH